MLARSLSLARLAKRLLQLTQSYFLTMERALRAARGSAGEAQEKQHATLNERLLFHGTSYETAVKIALEG